MTAPIVCGFDGSRPSLAAARLAASLARSSSRPVRYVYVVGHRGAYDDRDVRTVQGRLDTAISDAASLRVMIGAPAEQLLAAAWDASMLVVGTRTRRALSRAIARGVSTAVARAAAVPVIAVPKHPRDAAPEPAAGRALVCGVRDERDLACAASSAWLARELDLALTLVHVVPPPRLPVAAAGGAPPPGVLPTTDELTARAAALLDDIACAIAPSAPAVCRTVVASGQVGQQLDRVAASRDAVLVALGPSRRRALGRPLGRRCARHLVRRRNRAVMVCPPVDRVPPSIGSGGWETAALHVPQRVGRTWRPPTSPT